MNKIKKIIKLWGKKKKKQRSGGLRFETSVGGGDDETPSQPINWVWWCKSVNPAT
jgi:hypothetical protein